MCFFGILRNSKCIFSFSFAATHKIRLFVVKLMSTLSPSRCYFRLFIHRVFQFLSPRVGRFFRPNFRRFLLIKNRSKETLRNTSQNYYLCLYSARVCLCVYDRSVVCMCRFAVAFLKSTLSTQTYHYNRFYNTLFLSAYFITAFIFIPAQ